MQLLNNVEVALATVQSAVVPQQITDMDEMIRLKISSIPALLLNGRIISQKVVPEVSELVQLFRQALAEPSSATPND